MLVLQKLARYNLINSKLKYINDYPIGLYATANKRNVGKWELFMYKCHFDNRVILAFESWIEYGFCDEYYRVALKTYNINTKIKNEYLNYQDGRWQYLESLLDRLSKRLNLNYYISHLTIISHSA